MQGVSELTKSCTTVATPQNQIRKCHKPSKLLIKPPHNEFIAQFYEIAIENYG